MNFYLAPAYRPILVFAFLVVTVILAVVIVFVETQKDVVKPSYTVRVTYYILLWLICVLAASWFTYLLQVR